MPLNTVFAFYNDVPETNQYYEAIKALSDEKLLPETVSFQPDALLTKADLYELLLTFSGIAGSKSPNLQYSDTKNDAKYAPYIQKALDLGILQAPNLNQAFEPGKLLTKTRTLEIMFQTLDVGTDAFFDRENFAFIDLDKKSPYAPLAARASDLGILEPVTPDSFKMAKRITKAEAVDYLYKIGQYKALDTVTVIMDSSKINSSVFNNNYNEIEKELLDNPSFYTLLDVWQSLKTQYLYKDKLKDSDLVLAAIQGLVDQVNDTYTIFEKPGEDVILESLSSQYEGIGISIDLIDNKLTVISPFKDSPAEKAGLKPNDVITKINGISVKDMALKDVVGKIKGAAGTKVDLTILRGTQEITISVTRQNVLYKTVAYKFIPKGQKNIAYLELLSFNDKTFDEFQKAAKEIVAKNPDGLILDMRNNPGGYMDTAIDIISLFTDKIEPAVKLKFADNTVDTYNTTGNGLLKNIKTVVLVNKGSASASEIVAGALQDYKIAKIIGETSFGKGTVQDIAEYKDGSIFKYTTALWLTPNGNNINKRGIIPDKLVGTPTANVDSQLNSALEEF